MKDINNNQRKSRSVSTKYKSQKMKKEEYWNFDFDRLCKERKRSNTKESKSYRTIPSNLKRSIESIGRISCIPPKERLKIEILNKRQMLMNTYTFKSPQNLHSAKITGMRIKFENVEFDKKDEKSVSVHKSEIEKDKKKANPTISISEFKA